MPFLELCLLVPLEPLRLTFIEKLKILTGVQLMFFFLLLLLLFFFFFFFFFFCLFVFVFFAPGFSKLFGAQGSPSSGSLLNLLSSRFLFIRVIIMIYSFVLDDSLTS